MFVLRRLQAVQGCVFTLTVHKLDVGALFDHPTCAHHIPGPVRAVEIPKKGGTRILGIPNVVDRVAQTVAVLAGHGHRR
jgi:hypothetical protein